MCVLAALQNPVAINISFSVDTIAAVEKNTEIFDLQRCLYDHRNRDSLLQCFCLVIAVGWSAAIDLLNSRLFLNLPSFFFFFLGFFIFAKNTVSLYLSHSLQRPKIPALSLSLALTLPRRPKIPPKHYLFLALSLSLSQTQNPTTTAAFTTTPPPPPNHVDLVTTTWQPQSTLLASPSNRNPPHRLHLISIHLISFFYFFIFYYLCSMCYVICFFVQCVMFNVLSLFLLFVW